MYVLLFLSTIAISSAQQIYYPDENGNIYYNNNVQRFSSNPPYPLPQAAPTLTPSIVNSGSFNRVVPIPPRGTPEYDQYVNHVISTGLMKLTIAVKKVITTQSRNQYDNIVFAPVSMAASLALVMLGANGKTYQEIATLLGFATGVPDLDKKPQIVHQQFGRMILKLEKTSGFVFGSQVNFATAIFIQNNFPIRRLYKDTAESIYQSEVLNLDFQLNPLHAQKSINAWVSDRTRGKIKEVLMEPPSPDTRVMIASAMYFNAEWEHPFYEGGTKRRPFYTNGKENPSDIMVDMMSNGGSFPYFKDKASDCEIIGFPYKGNQTTMYVVKPLDSNKEKLKALEKTLTPEHLLHLVNNVRETEAVILFPKMLIDTTIDLKDSLEFLGVTTLFNPKEANLALLSPGATSLDNKNQNLGNSTFNPISSNYPKDSKDPYSDVLIFNRFGDTVNCTDLFEMKNNVTTCEQVFTNTTRKVIYKKIGDKVGRRFVRQLPSNPGENLDSLREDINAHVNPQTFQNPGLYADKVIHKVYMHITETGTEAAATTVTGLTKAGGRVVFRAEVPFFFFIMHEETKVIVFWGSVNRPTPFYASNVKR